MALLTLFVNGCFAWKSSYSWLDEQPPYTEVHQMKTRNNNTRGCLFCQFSQPQTKQNTML